MEFLLGTIVAMSGMLLAPVLQAPEPDQAVQSAQPAAVTQSRDETASTDQQVVPSKGGESGDSVPKAATGFRGHFACRTFSGLNRDLAVAVSDQEPARVSELLEAGADINARSGGSRTREMTLLQVAICYEWGLESVRLLIGAGASMEARDGRGNTALIYACQTSLGSNVEVVESLLHTGAKVDAPGARGMTPLMHAAMHDTTLEVLETLLKASADVKARDALGWTPLMHATRRRRENVKAVELLVAAGSDVNAAHKYGGTALSNAAYNGHTRVVQYLIKAGAKVNVADAAKWTPLICAAMNGHVEIVQSLLEAGADVKAADRLGRTALALARQNHHPAIVELLTRAGATRSP